MIDSCDGCLWHGATLDCPANYDPDRSNGHWCKSYEKKTKESEKMNEKNISKILIEIEKCEIFKSIVEALDKQIPHPLAPITGVPHCGKCGQVMALKYGDLNYCPNCGQRINWGDSK